MTDQDLARIRSFRGMSAVLEGPETRLSPREPARREVAAMNLLIVDDEQSIRETCTDVALQLDMKVTAVSTAEEAAELLEYAPVDILLTDLQLPGSGGLALLRRVGERYPEIALMVLTQYGTIDSAVEATRLGAVDYVTKPFRIEELKTRLERAAHSVDLQR
jgi:DNA-binding NtrC family response regulator